jgi:short-subunit dehydrogenase
MSTYRGSTAMITGEGAFVLHFSEALKFELRGRGVQVMAVCPAKIRSSAATPVTEVVH